MIYKAPELKIKAFGKELVFSDSNLNDARNYLAGGGKVEIKRENISVGTLQRK